MFLVQELNFSFSYSCSTVVTSTIAFSILAVVLVFCTKIAVSLLPARASEQGNVIGSVRIYIYIYVCVQKNL